MPDFTIQYEKLSQAVELLREYNLDMWLTFVRETHLTPDPALDLIYGQNVTWQSAFIVTRSGERIAIVGRYEVESIGQMGGYTQVIGYDADIVPTLRRVIEKLNPNFIAVNYSENDVAADGMSYGMWRLLNSALADTPYKHRLISAQKIIGSLRGRKSPAEVGRVRGAIKTTEEIIKAVTGQLEVGLSAEALYIFVRDEMKSRAVRPAWGDNCPTVAIGPDAPVGHTLPNARYVAERGHLIHIDLGVIQDGYVSDLQRVWYLRREGETMVPEVVQQAFNFAREALLRAADALRPGVMGWQVDEAARSLFRTAGYSEYQHATGHHIGRSIHDGATVLGPRWPRYGNTPEGIIEAGNIFTLELGFNVSGYGFVGLEEDVLVKQDGLEWLSTPQTEIFIVG